MRKTGIPINSIPMRLSTSTKLSFMTLYNSADLPEIAAHFEPRSIVSSADISSYSDSWLAFVVLLVLRAECCIGVSSILYRFGRQKVFMTTSTVL